MTTRTQLVTDAQPGTQSRLRVALRPEGQRGTGRRAPGATDRPSSICADPGIPVLGSK